MFPNHFSDCEPEQAVTKDEHMKECCEGIRIKVRHLCDAPQALFLPVYSNMNVKMSLCIPPSEIEV